MALLAFPIAGAGQPDSPAPRELYLEVFVNGRAMNLVTRFTDHGNGLLVADADELRNMYNRPLRKRFFWGEQFGAVSGADMYPAS
ncbi:hypothetical protein [Gemmobacter nanjingensis]|uniref:hypothetical protein n=1 Tax=Gemmobacter nanjingensis TaxID=488454 RepID=UPI0016754DED|nr:hypothetical protein [Gemmobacter nanjingensis]